MSLFPQYIHIVNPKLKHIYLSFDNEGNLVIKSPKVTQRKIEQLLIKKASWINSAREKIQQKKGKTLDFSKDLVLYFLGNPYPLTLAPHSKKRVQIDFDGEDLHFFTIPMMKNFFIYMWIVSIKMKHKSTFLLMSIFGQKKWLFLPQRFAFEKPNGSGEVVVGKMF